MKKYFAVIVIMCSVILLFEGCRTNPPEEERQAAEKAFKDAALGKDCDKENYMAAEELLNKAREEVNNKKFDKAKELFVAAKEKSDEIVKYYRSHPDDCMPKKDDGKAKSKVGKGGGSENAEEVPLFSKDPNWQFPVIHFEFNDYNVKSEDAPKIKQVAEWMQNFKEVSIRIEGHADERGSVDFNMSLGEKRAQEVQNQLIQQGIDKNRIKIISYGEEKPLDTGHTEEAWFQNRRAEFKRTN